MTITELVGKAHMNAVEKGFHEGRDNIAEKLMLIVSELGEALDAHRAGRMFDCSYTAGEYLDYDKKEFEAAVKDTFQDEIADAFIRLADLCGYMYIDIEDHITAKMRYNEMRPYKHGKDY